MKRVMVMLLFLLVLTPLEAQEEALRYVAKSPSVGLLQSASPEAPILLRLTPGEEITLLGQNGGFVNVRTISGMTGWLAAGDVTAEIPAENQLVTANQRIEQLEAEIAELQRQLRNAQASAQRASRQLDSSQASAASEVTRLQEELELAGSRLATLRERNQSLEAEIAELELAEESRRMLARTELDETPVVSPGKQRWWLALTAGGLLLAGLVGGYALKTRQLRRRFHGLDI